CTLEEHSIKLAITRMWRINGVPDVPLVIAKVIGIIYSVSNLQTLTVLIANASGIGLHRVGNCIAKVEVSNGQIIVISLKPNCREEALCQVILEGVWYAIVVVIDPISWTITGSADIRGTGLRCSVVTRSPYQNHYDQ